MRIAQELLTELSDEQALEAIDKIIHHYAENAKKGERLGKMIDRVGLEPFEQAVS